MSVPLTRSQIVIILAGAGVIGVSLGVRHTMGLYLVPMTFDLGWSREAFGLAMAVQNLLWGAMQPLVGGLADKYGSGKVIAAGGALYALGVLGMANAVTPTELILTGGVLIGVGMAGAGISVVYGAVARAVLPERRTYAVAMVSTIGALGPVAMPQVANALIGGAGWYAALLASAVIAALIIALARLMRRGAEPETGEAEMSWREALGHAMRHPGYLLLVAGFFVCGFHVTFIATHMPGFIAISGLDGGVAATSLMIIGLANVVGTYIAGEMSKKYRQKNLLSLIYLARAGLIAALLMLPVSEWTIYAFSFVFGLLWLSTVPLTSGVVARIFGAKHLGMLFGIVFFDHQIGAFLGAWLGGLAFDITASYDAMWYASIALGLLAALLHWPIRDQPFERLMGVRAS